MSFTAQGRRRGVRNAPGVLRYTRIVACLWTQLAGREDEVRNDVVPFSVGIVEENLMQAVLLLSGALLRNQNTGQSLQRSKCVPKRHQSVTGGGFQYSCSRQCRRKDRTASIIEQYEHSLLCCCCCCILEGPMAIKRYKNRNRTLPLGFVAAMIVQRVFNLQTSPAFATLTVCCSIASCMVPRSCCRIAENSSMQQSPRSAYRHARIAPLNHITWTSVNATRQTSVIYT